MLLYKLWLTEPFSLEHCNVLLHYPTIGLKISLHFNIQSEVKPKPIVFHSLTFSRASRQLHDCIYLEFWLVHGIFCDLCDWLLTVITLFLGLRHPIENHSLLKWHLLVTLDFCTLFYSLRRQVAAISKLTARGMFFWDYGNAFLLEASRAGEDQNSVRIVINLKTFYAFSLQPVTKLPTSCLAVPLFTGQLTNQQTLLYVAISTDS